jgi:prolyl-tRNA editing enzyme YbaK/EbsC (Cys-tRNA(Pro) deacylase)
MVGIDGEEHIYVMLIPGDKVLKIKRVRQLTNGIRIDLADRDVISKTLGLTVGALSPIQLIGKAKRYFMDNHVFREERVAMSSGDPNSGILLNPHGLAETLQATTCDIVSVR